MSIRVYLKKAIKQAVGYSTGNIGEGKYFIGSFRLRKDDTGFLYFDLLHHNDNIHEFFDEFIERITLRDTLIGGAKRETGIYRHESAMAELSLDTNGETEFVHIAIEAKKLEDLREIFTLIRAGEIRPVKSYEGPQNGMSAHEMAELIDKQENELADLTNSLNRSHRDIVEAKAVADDAQEMAEATRLKLESIKRELIDWRCLKLRASILPFRRTKSVIKEIDDILGVFGSSD